MWRSVNQSYVINSVFDNRKIDVGLLKCDVLFENSTFKKGNERTQMLNYVLKIWESCGNNCMFISINANKP